MGRWSRGMILPSGGRGRGFDSRTAPFYFKVVIFKIDLLKMVRTSAVTIAYSSECLTLH